MGRDLKNQKRVIFWSNEDEKHSELKKAKLELKHKTITNIVINNVMEKTVIYFK